MTRHKVIVHIPSAEYARVNRLLAIKSFEDMSENELVAQGVNKHQTEGIYCAEFDDGSFINFDLCSGSNDYWDDVVWMSPDGTRDVTLGCAFKLGNVEAEIESELYIVKIVVDK